jgi:hypothetical protein
LITDCLKNATGIGRSATGTGAVSAAQGRLDFIERHLIGATRCVSRATRDTPTARLETGFDKTRFTSPKPSWVAVLGNLFPRQPEAPAGLEEFE